MFPSRRARPQKRKQRVAQGHGETGSGTGCGLPMDPCLGPRKMEAWTNNGTRQISPLPLEEDPMLPRNPTRTRQTEEAYLRGGRRHLQRASRRRPWLACPIVALLLMLREDKHKLKPATVRLYLQELTACIDRLIRNSAVEPHRREEILDEIRILLERRKCRRVKRRTSSLKVVNATPEECKAVYKELVHPAAGRPANKLDQVVAMLVYLGPRLGFRPVELNGARRHGRFVILRCAKATNGRAPAKERKIDVSSFPKKVRILVGHLLVALAAALAQYKTWERLHKALSERLARACQRAEIRRLSLYSLRHVAIATWKAAGLDRAVIAALAGHRSAETASRHYAAGRHGWTLDDGLAVADPELVSAIRLIWSARPEPPEPEPDESLAAFRI